MSILYIVATPIGNLGDASERALETLRRVELIATEDTRVTRKLLTHFDIHTKTISFNPFNADRRIPILLNHLEHLDLALTSDAGTPGISDPGHELITRIDPKITQVIPIPGPSAVTAVLSAAPFSTDQFYFAGFAPRKKGALRQLTDLAQDLKVPVVMFESPRRLLRLLNFLDEYIPQANLFIMREISKKYEDSFYGTINDAKIKFQEPRGEFTLVLQPPLEAPSEVNSEEIDRLIQSLEGADLKPREIAKAISSITQVPNSDVYRTIVERRSHTPHDD